MIIVNSALPASLEAKLSMRVFETRRANGSALFSLLTCLHTTTFTLLSTFSPLGMISIKSLKIWKTPLSRQGKCLRSLSISYPTRTRGIIVNYLQVIHHFISQCFISHSAVKNSLENGLSKHIYNYLVFLRSTKSLGKRRCAKECCYT